MNSFECPATGDKCDYCVGLAQVAFASIYQSGHSAMSMNEVITATENSNVKAIVEEQRGLVGQPCNVRQDRAKKIGTRLGIVRR